MKRSRSSCMENDTFTILSSLKEGLQSRPWQTSSGMVSGYHLRGSTATDIVASLWVQAPG